MTLVSFGRNALMNDFMNLRSNVYIRTDEKGRITRCEGEYTLPADLTDC